MEIGRPSRYFRPSKIAIKIRNCLAAFIKNLSFRFLKLIETRTGTEREKVYSPAILDGPKRQKANEDSVGKACPMKRFFHILLLSFSLSSLCLSEQLVEHGGREVMSFDVPQVDYQGKREGKVTRTFFSRPVGEGNLKITVTTKGWMSELKAEQRFDDDRRLKRAGQHTRLNDPVDIPGALKTLAYSMDSPYIAQAVVVYTKDFRCEFLVTGTGEAADQIEPTYQRLLETLKVVPRTKIGEIKIGD
jgi:hypothetical protein